ncbi:hypothetical protein C4559_04200 [Candidatus Microgenomates bacterium]|nr:MAG: hypothetical protein C4559_04200 [Candidatus Microgenomates bacterium]
MPIKNTIKIYIENGYYHIYNRGVDKREIFSDPQDCVIFLFYLKLYLASPEILEKEEKFLTPRMQYKLLNLNLSKEIDLLAFSLMPNHFHLEIKQYTKNAIEKFCRRVLTSYSQYFNKKHKRIGALFESSYKAVLLDTERQLLYLSSYIHRNPMKLQKTFFDYTKFSSYPYYLGFKTADWIKPKEIMSFFNNSKNITNFSNLSYRSFVENFKEDPKEALGSIVLEKDC